MFISATPFAAAPARVSHPMPPSDAWPLDEADRLALTLLGLVDDGNVRAMEAIACVIVRNDRGQICANAILTPARRAAALRAGAASRAMAARIAARALAGAIVDPCRGAVAFHRIGELPEWAAEHVPVAEIGAYLFYRSGAMPRSGGLAESNGKG